MPSEICFQFTVDIGFLIGKSLVRFEIDMTWKDFAFRVGAMITFDIAYYNFLLKHDKNMISSKETGYSIIYE